MTDSDGIRLPPDRPETWKPHPRFPLYEVSDKGRHRRSGGRVLATRVSNRGYVLMDFRTEDGKKVTCSAQTAVLDTFDRYPCPEGLESLHGEYGPLVNWWPENLRRDTRKANEGEKPEPPPPPVPTFECVNRCGSMVVHEGRRCLSCVVKVGEAAAAMLDAGMNLQAVAAHFGYTGPDWVYSLAVRHGYGGTKAAALAQHPSWSQRVRLTLNGRRLWGDAA